MSTVTNPPLTKSQKKRMKRNLAKTRKAEEAAVRAATELDPFNAHDAMKIGLKNLGFELEEINKSIENMWNAGLDYSDINTVAAFITTSKEEPTLVHKVVDVESAPSFVETSKSIDITKSTSKEESSKSVAITKSSSEEEVRSMSSAVSSKEANHSAIPVTVTNVSNNNVLESVFEPPVSVVGSNSPPPSTVGESKASQNSETLNVEAKSPLTLKEKLEIVATNDDLTDAIVALTEWVVKAARPDEIKELCGGSKSCALRTVICRAITTSGPRNFSGQLLDLVGSILRNAGISSTEILPSAKALMRTLTRSKSVIDGDKSMNEEIAGFVADTVTSYISKPVEKLATASACTSGSLSRLEDEIETLKTRKIPNNAGVAGLAAKRDHFKVLAQKHCDLMNMNLSTISGENAEPENSNSDTKDEMLTKIFGSKYDEVVASKAKYDELKKLQLQNNSVSIQRESMTSNIDALKAKKETVSEKIISLEIELKRLSAEGDGLEEQIDYAKKKLIVFDKTLSVEAREAEKVLKDVSQIVKLGDSVSNVVDSLQDFQSEMNKCASSEISLLTANNPAVDLQLDLAPKMTSYIESMNGYFKSELKLVSFLQHRAHSLRESFPRLEMEIEECESLGMSSNVMAMKKKLSEMQQNIVDDDDVIKAFQKEAEEMKSKLSEALKEYKSFGANGAETYGPLLKDVQFTIDAIL